jgi:hypothetical protein
MALNHKPYRITSPCNGFGTLRRHQVDQGLATRLAAGSHGAPWTGPNLTQGTQDGPAISFREHEP